MSLEEIRHVQMDYQDNNQQPLEDNEDLMISDLSMDDLPNFTMEQLLGLDLLPKPISKDSGNSDIDMFGDDDDFELALAQDLSWMDQKVINTPSTTEQYPNQNTNIPEFSDDDEFELALTQHPSWMDEKAINTSTIEQYPTQKTNMQEFDPADDLPELQEPFSDMTGIDYDMNQIHLEDNETPLIINIDSGTDSAAVPAVLDVMDSVSTDICSQRMQSLDLMDNLVIVISMSSSDISSPPLCELSTPPNISLSSPSSPSIVSLASTQSNISPSTSTLTAGLSLSDSTSTAELSSRPSPAPGQHITLRKRHAIQIKPFTIESAQFNKLLGRATAKSKLNEVGTIEPSIQDDDSDTDFTPADTQRVDEHLDEIPIQELLSLGIHCPKPNKNVNKINPPALCAPPIDLQKQDAILEVESARQKYGMDRLILPAPRKIKDKMKKKAATFEIKKGSKRKKDSSSRIPSRLAEIPAKDIFDFDLYTRTPAKSSALSTPIVIDDSTASNSPISHMEHDQNDVMEEDAMEEDDMEEDEEIPVFRRPRLKKRKTILDGSDSDESQHEENGPPEVLTQEQLDSIFDFPAAPRRHLRNAVDPEDDIVPIINDESEHRENKRQRMGIRDLKAQAFKNVLPASFYKLNEKNFSEELRLLKLSKKPKKVLPVASTSRCDGNRAQRNSEDVYAAFRASQSDNSDDGGNGDYDDGSAYFNPPIPTKTKQIYPQNRYGSSSSNQRPNIPISSGSRNIPRNIPKLTSVDSLYPSEAMEDNRISRQRNRASGSNSNKTSTESRRPVKQSSIAIVRPPNTYTRRINLIGVANNSTPLRRRRKPKRSTDDIYVHAPYFLSYWNQRPQNGNNNGSIYGNNNASIFKENVKQRAFDDICIHTKPQNVWYKSGLIYIRNYDISDYLHKPVVPKKKQQQVILLYSLEPVIKRVRGGLMDIDLRCIIGLKNTVYLYHRLFPPLLSATPNKKSAYTKFKETHSELVLFGNVYFWRDINPNRKYLIDKFFNRVFHDISHMCFNDQYNPRPDMNGELPDHDYFYVFVSLCLTQWIPCHRYEIQLELTELFVNRIRGLAYMVAKVSEARPYKEIPWKSIVKLMLHILDWTCRLHHLGVDKSIWSVTECTQIIIDLLVYIGHEPVKIGKEEYLIEAWICLIQIMSVSSRKGGYHFNEQVFLSQMTGSIKRKSRDSEHYNFEKRRTTQLWAQNLDHILKKYMML